MDVSIASKSETVPMFDIVGDPRVFRVRVADGNYEDPQGAHVSFHTAPTIPEFTVKYRKPGEEEARDENGRVYATVAHQNHTALTTLFNKAGIETVRTNHSAVVLKDPQQLDKAMAALKWPEPVQRAILDEAATVQERVMQVRREGIDRESRDNQNLLEGTLRQLGCPAGEIEDMQRLILSEIERRSKLPSATPGSHAARASRPEPAEHRGQRIP
jgi:hypothetical protein